MGGFAHSRKSIASRLAWIGMAPTALLASPPPAPEPAQVHAGPAAAQASPEMSAPTDIYRLVKLFDFNERPQGNFEETPMHWQKLRGRGLPSYAKGVFDDQIGAQAPPSFRLMGQTANVGYEYQAMDVPALANTDYFIVAQIRTAHATHSRAFVAAFFIDRFGERVAGSERVSALVESADAGEEWRRVQIDLPGQFPGAYALRLQLWLAQNMAWSDPRPGAVDPIARRDVNAMAWFDDLAVYRLPRTRLRFSNPGNLVVEGAQATFQVAIDNATPNGLSATITIYDESAASVAQLAVHAPPSEAQGLIPEFDAPPHANAPTPAQPLEPAAGHAPEDHGDGASSEPIHDEHAAGAHAQAPAHNEASRHSAGRTRASQSLSAPLPTLAPGAYRADLVLLGGDVPALRRSLRFAVVPRLSARHTRAEELGVDIGAWRSGANADALALITTLGVGAVKLAATVRPYGEDQGAAEWDELSRLVHDVAREGIEPIGVMLATLSESAAPAASPTWRYVAERRDWARDVAPLIAHFGGSLTTWQLGREASELALPGAGWSLEAIAAMRAQLKRIMTLPQVVVPQSSYDPVAASDFTPSIWVESRTPTRQLPRLLAGDAAAGAGWVTLAGAPQTRAECEEFARRVVLARAAQPAKLFVEAPLAFYDEGGAATLAPTIAYAPLRTLFHALAARRILSAFAPAPDTLMLLFEGGDGACLIGWSWRHDSPPQRVELYLGAAPRGRGLWGEEIPLELVEGRAQLSIGPRMLLIEDVDARLALLQMSYSLAPRTVQAGNPDAAPLLSFRNPYEGGMSGEVTLTPPRDWRISPATLPFQLAPGGDFSQSLKLEFPPQQLAEQHALDVTLQIFEPQAATLRFVEMLEVGLSDIEVDVSAHWEGPDLVVEHTLRNRSPSLISFTAHCDLPGQPRLDGFFSNVAPDATATQTYVYPRARALSGEVVRLTIREVRGPRSMSRLVKIPP